MPHNWTSDRPAEPGLYWLWMGVGKVGHVDVWAWDGHLLINHGWDVWDSKFDNAHWQGPIAVPKVPEGSDHA